MNEWGHLEQKNEGQPQKNERSDQLLRGSERAPAAEHASDGDKKHVTKGLNDREQVERTADRIRDELLLTLEELDRRRTRVMDVRYQASRHQDLIVGVAITAAVLTGIGLGVAIYRARHREEILARHRAKAVRRAWQHPDRVASSAEQRPLPVELGRKLIIIFATALASNIAKNSVQSLVPRQRPAPAKT
jgi:cation diffusion facilitator CzcD-associated flavoprotein CzcO